MKKLIIVTFILLLFSSKPHANDEWFFKCGEEDKFGEYHNNNAQCNDDFSALVERLNTRGSQKDLTVFIEAAPASNPIKLETDWFKLSDLNYNLTIRGAGAYSTILEFESGASFVIMNSKELSLSNLSIESDHFNPPIYALNSDIIVSDVRLKNEYGACILFKDDQAVHDGKVLIENSYFERCRDSLTVMNAFTIELLNNVFNYYGMLEQNLQPKGLELIGFASYLIDGNHFYGGLDGIEEFYIESRKPFYPNHADHKSIIKNNYFESIQSTRAIEAKNHAISIKSNHFYFNSVADFENFPARIKIEAVAESNKFLNYNFTKTFKELEGSLGQLCSGSNYCIFE